MNTFILVIVIIHCIFWVLSCGLLFSYFQGEFPNTEHQSCQDLRFCFIYSAAGIFSLFVVLYILYEKEGEPVAVGVRHGWFGFFSEKYKVE